MKRIQKNQTDNIWDFHLSKSLENRLIIGFIKRK